MQPDDDHSLAGFSQELQKLRALIFQPASDWLVQQPRWRLYGLVLGFGALALGLIVADVLTRF